MTTLMFFFSTEQAKYWPPLEKATLVHPLKGKRLNSFKVPLRTFIMTTPSVKAQTIWKPLGWNATALVSSPAWQGNYISRLLFAKFQTLM